MWHTRRLEALALLGHDNRGREARYLANPKDALVDAYDAKSGVELA